jgi:hypothetical protein
MGVEDDDGLEEEVHEVKVIKDDSQFEKYSVDAHHEKDTFIDLKKPDPSNLSQNSIENKDSDKDIPIQLLH